MRIKKAYFFMMVLYCLAVIMLGVLGFIYLPEFWPTEQLISLAVFSVILILLNVVSAFSKNDYYLSLHGTLMVVMSSFNLSQL